MGVSMYVICLYLCRLSTDEDGDQNGGFFYDLLVLHDHHHNQLYDDYGQLVALCFYVHA